MADGSSNDQDNTEEVKVYCDEGDAGKSGSENFTLEGIGLLNEAAQNANYDVRFNFNGGIVYPFNFLPMMFGPCVYPGAMNPQWFPRFPFPAGFPCFPNQSPNVSQLSDVKPTKPDNAFPNWMVPLDARLNPGDMFPRPKEQEPRETSKRPYVKKPLNAFMIFMREKRNEIMVECTMKESASVNQILGKKWHELDKAEQNKYYELARDEKERHKQMHPNWSARDNYASRVRKRRHKSPCLQLGDQGDCSTTKKCRALLGVKQWDMWCKHCQGKKKCTRAAPNEGTDGSEGELKLEEGAQSLKGAPVGMKEERLASDVN